MDMDKYQACSEMLREILAGYVPAKPALFNANASPRDPKQVALYAAACGLAEAAITFAVLSEGYEIAEEAAREQAKDPRWVAAQSREVLASLFREIADNDRFDDGR